MPSTETAKGSPTIIDIEPSPFADVNDRGHPYYGMTELNVVVRSSAKFDRVTALHLGFKARSQGKRNIRFDGSRYIVGEGLEPHVSAWIEIKPFQICMQNVGDSFMRVSIRLRDGMERCKMTILQESKASREIDDFIEYEGIYYCTTVINCLQTIRIEEIQETQI
jgi:hypothetical protein